MGIGCDKPHWWVAWGFISVMETEGADNEGDGFLPCYLIWGSVYSGGSSAWLLPKMFKRAVM